MGQSPDEDDQITNRVIKARFLGMDEKILARLKAISELNDLPTDPKILADDLQSLAVLAMHTHENVEMLIGLIQRIGETGAITVTLPEKPPNEPPNRKRF